MKKLSLLIVLAIVLDQLTKYLICRNFAVGESVPVISGLFSLTYVRNIGAAWGILAGWRIALVALAVVMVFLLIRYRAKVFPATLLGNCSFVLLISGIIGNAIDRARLGYVVDFLDFYTGNSHFPSFNVADSCICVGVFLYMIINLLSARNTEKEAK